MTTVDGALLDALLPRRAPATTAGLPIFRATLRHAVEAALQTAIDTDAPAADAVEKATDALMVMIDTYTAAVR